jgi:DNA-3-methyladenine glycosylase
VKADSSSSRILPRGFYARETVEVAKALVGSNLVRVLGRSRLVGKIVEVEAYRGSDDPASHAYRGVTPRNVPMFGEPGHAYVYFTYGNHYCLNATTQESGTPGAVLIRAVEPLEGIHFMRKRRPKASNTALTNGPGKLTKALGIDKSFNKIDLTKYGPLFITRGSGEKPRIACSARVGIREGTNLPWRFYLPENPHVSKSKAASLGAL